MLSKHLVLMRIVGFVMFMIPQVSCADGLPKLGRGINFGNKLESPKGQLWGPGLEAWNFTRAKEGGFDSVRLPIRWHEYAANTSPYTIEAEFLDRVDWAINQTLANHLAVVINMHHYNPLFAEPQAEKAKFLALWQQIAERFQDVPNDRVVFEILNEPNGNLTAELWNTFLLEAYTVIRQSNPHRYIMIGSAEWGGLAAMNKLELPNDDRLIFTVHYYEPFEFTHQGAEWVNGADAWCGTRWLATEQEQQFIRGRLDEVANWAKQHNNIHVFVGEFGTYKKCALPEDQARWADFVARESEQRGFSWAYWEFNAGFGCYGATESMGWNYLHQALIPEAAPK